MTLEKTWAAGVWAECKAIQTGGKGGGRMGKGTNVRATIRRRAEPACPGQRNDLYVLLLFYIWIGER
jgi:hypothetical protein